MTDVFQIRNILNTTWPDLSIFTQAVSEKIKELRASGTGQSAQLLERDEVGLLEGGDFREPAGLDESDVVGGWGCRRQSGRRLFGSRGNKCKFRFHSERYYYSRFLVFARSSTPTFNETPCRA